MTREVPKWNGEDAHTDTHLSRDPWEPEKSEVAHSVRSDAHPGVHMRLQTVGACHFHGEWGGGNISADAER